MYDIGVLHCKRGNEPLSLWFGIWYTIQRISIIVHGRARSHREMVELRTNVHHLSHRLEGQSTPTTPLDLVVCSAAAFPRSRTQRCWSSGEICLFSVSNFIFWPAAFLSTQGNPFASIRAKALAVASNFLGCFRRSLHPAKTVNGDIAESGSECAPGALNKRYAAVLLAHPYPCWAQYTFGTSQNQPHQVLVD